MSELNLGEASPPKPTIFERIVEAIVVPAMLIIVAIGFAAVVMRFVGGGKHALFWSEEVMRYGFIWIFWLCAPVLLWRGSMFMVDILISALPEKVERALRVVHCVLILGLMYPYITLGISMANLNAQQLSSALQVSLFWVYIALPVGAILISAVTLFHLYLLVTGKPLKRLNS
jgi:TRAP-type C4-dicarboxylate transport system permease small subunit